MSDGPPDPLALTVRTGLPPSLRVLAEAYPRADWDGHGNFGAMVRFWLERHAMFRELVGRLTDETEAVLDRRTDAAAYPPRLARLGGFFLDQLHGHHQIEDVHYFPQLVGLDPRLAAGFALLEADHGAIDGLLHDFADRANGVLGADPGAARDAAAPLHAALARFSPLLERHLTDEEDLIVPVILDTGFEG